MSDLIYWQSRDCILCPHCDHAIRDVWDYEFPLKDGYTTEIDCPNCEDMIFVQIDVETKYTSSNTAFK